MAAPATPEVATDVSFSNAETGRMPTPNKLNLSVERMVIQPGRLPISLPLLALLLVITFWSRRLMVSCINVLRLA